MATASSLPQDNIEKNLYDNLNHILDYLNSLKKKIDSRLSVLEKQRKLIEQRIAEKEQRKAEAKKEKENPTIAGLIAASGLSAEDVAEVEKKYGTFLYEDYEKIKQSLLEKKREVKAREKQEQKEIKKAEKKDRRAELKLQRKEEFAKRRKQCFRFDNDELIEISKKDEKAFMEFVRGKGKFKSTSSAKAFKLFSPLFKGVGKSAGKGIGKLFHININTIVDEDGRKEKKKIKLPIKEAAILIYKQTIGKIVDKVKTSVNSGIKLVQTKIAASKLGGAIVNAKTGISSVGKILKYGFDGLKIGGKAIGGFGTAIAPAALLYLATGGAILPAAAAFVTIGATSTINSILKDPHLSSIKGIRIFQLKYGEGQFYTTSIHSSSSIKLASEELPALQNTIKALNDKIAAGQRLTAGEFSILKESQLKVDAFQKPNISQFSRLTGAIGTASTFASLGFAIGTLFGVGPQAALIAGIVGGGGSYAINTLRGLGLKSIVNGNSSLLKLFAKIPFADALAVMQSTLWVGSQLKLIDSVYKGDVGAYLKENFLFAGSTALTSITNYLQVASTVFSYVALISRLGATFTLLSKFQGLLKATPAGIAAFVGSTAALATLTMLGLQLGPVAMLGAGIGSVIGLAGGAALAAVLLTNPVGWAGMAIIAVTSFFTTGIGAWLGSIGDKALNRLTGGIMNAINMWASLFQLLSILSMKFNSDNLIMFALSCLSLIQIWSKEQEMATTNVSATSKKTNTSAAPSIESFSYYKVNFINNLPLSVKTRSNLLNFIAENKEYFDSKYPEKQIYLTTAPNATFESDKIVMLSINMNDVINANYSNLAQEIRSQNSTLANVLDIKEQQN